jgi:hypothetical protein
VRVPFSKPPPPLVLHVVSVALLDDKLWFLLFLFVSILRFAVYDPKYYIRFLLIVCISSFVMAQPCSVALHFFRRHMCGCRSVLRMDGYCFRKHERTDICKGYSDCFGGGKEMFMNE